MAGCRLWQVVVVPKKRVIFRDFLHIFGFIAH